MKKFLLLFIFSGLVLTIGQTTQAQGLNIGSDFMSRYVWRGLDFANSPSIQPSLSYSTKSGFEVGYWGAYSVTAVNYQETDLYLSYTFNDLISVGITDYFFPLGDSTSINNHYFAYGKDVSGHIFEVNLRFNGTEKIPVYLALNYNFYGADADHSFYGEIGYEGSCKSVDYSVFAGFTSGKGIYLPDGSDQFSFVNLGLSVSKEVQISEKFTLPVVSSLIINPQAQNIFLVFGFSL